MPEIGTSHDRKRHQSRGHTGSGKYDNFSIGSLSPIELPVETSCYRTNLLYVTNSRNAFDNHPESIFPPCIESIACCRLTCSYPQPPRTPGPHSVFANVRGCKRLHVDFSGHSRRSDGPGSVGAGTPGTADRSARSSGRTQHTSHADTRGRRPWYGNRSPGGLVSDATIVPGYHGMCRRWIDVAAWLLR